MSGLRRVLADFAPVSVGITASLGDYEWVKQTSPAQMCGWLAGLRDMVDEAASHALVLHHTLDILWDQAAAESERRWEAGRTPLACAACGGHGGSSEGGHCEVCQGTAIDPSDPQSPL